MPFEQAVKLSTAQKSLRSCSRCRRCIPGLLAVVLAACSSAVAVAQDYKVDPVDDKARLNRVTAQRSLKDPAIYTAEKAKVDEFFTRYYFPAMTNMSPQSLADLGKLRYELFKLYLWNTSNEELQRNLTTQAYNAMRPVVVGNYHPAVRYNAILVLGLLDAQYAVEGAGGRPPKPLPQANRLLIQVVEAGAAGKAVPPPLILGALIGLERHAKYHAGLPQDSAAATVAAALKVASLQQPLPEMDREVFDWTRLQAARVLIGFGGVGANNQIHDALVKLIGDLRSLDDRCAAAAMTARIKYDGAKVDGAAAAEQMLKLARDLSDAEAKRARSFEDAHVGAAFGAGPRPTGRGEFDGGYSGEQRDDFPRSHVLERLVSLRAGLNALKPVVPEASQANFDAVLAAIAPVIASTSNKDSVGLEIAREVRSMASSINSIVPAAAAPDAATATAAAKPRTEETAR